MSLDPIRATKAITDSYLDYLSTTFQLRDTDLQRQFTEQLRVPGKFVKGPILEATPPFEEGATIEALIKEKLLSPRFRRLRSESKGGPLRDGSCALYTHQEEAIRKAVGRGRNTVVATGTGSGKTEAFLVPILNHLFLQEERGELRPGVRALLLYPMNALANDQMARMRELLRNYPSITFGRYTGETETERKDALEKYRKMFRREPYGNELISRNEMRDSPPHILLTNYAMLEYLLLRPDDHVFFDGEYAGDWRFLVFDEAHTYAGAKGIEMAMLVRRLKDRVADGEKEKLQCIATSATLGKGEEDFPRVAEFAEQLFGERFEWDKDDGSRRDVIKASRKPMGELSDERWELAPSLYAEWQRILGGASGEQCVSSLVDKGRQSNVPDGLLAKAENVCNGDAASFLYEVLRGDRRIAVLRGLLQEKPRYLGAAAARLFGKTPQARENTVALVDLAARARPVEDEQALLPARYHLFVRAIEGAYLALSPVRRLYLERQETVDVDGRTYAAFELATCRQCGAMYLVGEEQVDDGDLKLAQPGREYFKQAGNLKYHLLLDQHTEQVPENEDEAVSVGEELYGEETNEYKLCTRCGAIDKSTLVSPLCGCESPEHVRLIRVPSKNGQVHKCPACGRQSPSNLVWRFLTGRDATASVLAAALYQQIPPRDRDLDEPVEEIDVVQDEWSSTSTSREEGPQGSLVRGEGRQLLIFSDSRQDAAFFAPYLNRTYSQILRRRLILKALEDHADSVVQNKWRVEDLVNPLQQTLDELHLFPEKSLQGRKAEAWKWILYELLAIDRRNSLEGLGCLGFSLVRPRNWKAPRPLMAWGLSEDEVWTLFVVLLDSLRTKGAIRFPDSVSPEDEFFAPRNREYYFRGNGSNRRRHISSWAPSAKGVLNSRLDFLVRLGDQLGLGRTREDCNRILKQIWSRSLKLHDPASCWNDLFSDIVLPGEDVVYRLKPRFWELRPGVIDAKVSWYYCNTCHNLTLLNLRGVCPTYRCEGQLRHCDPAELFQDNHYRRLYTSIEPINLVAKEHTAQLTSETAAELQTKFIDGEVNVLSCSTTFELGVDVGRLETVFMRNVPPSAANYVQRAGRAGRRTGSTAFALTFAQRRSHDLTHFNEPERMVSGEIQAPHFRLANDKIARRHLYATALADFWKKHPDTFRNVESFFFSEAKSGPERLAEYLEAKPENLGTSLQRIVPEELRGRVGLAGWAWTSGLLDKEGVLSKAADDVTQVVEQLEKARYERHQHKRPSDFILRVINTIKKDYLLSFLSRKNVIPKYGFPVDVVSLQILHHSDEARGLELDRDLRIALSEYAPSSQVVAGGKLWTSRYVKRLPDRGWLKYEYAVCDHCQCYQSVPTETGQTLDFCQACGQPLEGKNQGKFIIPQFGFITSVKRPDKPGDSRPQKTYTTRKYYSGKSEESDRLETPLQGTTLIAIPASEGELAVINHAGYRGFKVCHWCGYTVLGNEDVEKPHTTPWGTECQGTPTRTYLGHEFKTDILQLRFEGYAHAERGFWLSLLYALLDGASEALDIDRQDLDGCLYPYAGDPCMPALVLFDEVPGGAGHVRRIARSEETVLDVLRAALEKLQRCDCGGDEGNTSCYGCLRNYRNQYCHDELERGMVIDFLENALAV
jgi:superfamily II DNA/RNA helicase